MIYIDDSEITDSQFTTLLEKTRSILLDGQDSKVVPSPLDFEDQVFDAMQIASANGPFKGFIRKGGKHSFPDIIARNLFGIEIKMTTGDKWTSTGNSVLETTRVETVEKIYIFFGKFGGVQDFKYRPYGECMNEVGVTHSPRYKINMNLGAGNTIFDKIGYSYEEVRRNPNPIKLFKDYYRKQLKDGEELWWIDNAGGDTLHSPIVRQYRTLSAEDKKMFMIESMILFPEIFGNTKIKYERVAAYLVTHYNVVSANIRDIFTAGGREKNVEVMDKSVDLPRRIVNLRKSLKQILEVLSQMDEEKLKHYWKIDKLPANRENHWRTLLDHHSTWTADGITILSTIKNE